MICTPQTIVLDANVFTRNPELAAPTAIRTEIDAGFRGFGPVVASAPVTERQPITARTITPPRCDGCTSLFVPAFAPVATDSDIEQAQRALCQRPDGDVGPSTLAALRIFEQVFARDPAVSADGLMSEAELQFAAGAACIGEDWRSYFNPFEVVAFKDNPAALASTLRAINAGPTPGPDLAETTPLTDPALRPRFAQARSAVGCEALSFPTRPGADPAGQMTEECVERIAIAAR